MIALSGVTIHQGAFSLCDVSFDVAEGQYAVLMGRTGSGKTTLLEAICGLRRVAQGSIRLMGRDVTRLRPAARGVGYVPQDGGMFSRLTVREHLGFALAIRRWPRHAIQRRVDELAERLGLEHLLDRRPYGLSGGEVQRVALGRALAMRPGVLLLDEPLSALDEDTRAEMHDLLRAVQHETRVTVLHVTHNRSEACRLADLVLELRDGQVQPSGTPPGRCANAEPPCGDSFARKVRYHEG
ncbi:MAG: ATP-binding cassette domain-containing protein [Thermoguttaceae bacterium]|jgi:ABC-type sugar transport system ATPase subunit|nr:ATP-binding cassette domain-containing protein [Thermoguttaceae bacterium]